MISPMAEAGSGMMKRLRCAAALLLVALLSGLAHTAAALESGPKPDVRLLIDISGSMRDSDPENLRAPALDLIVVQLVKLGVQQADLVLGVLLQELRNGEQG